MTLKLYVFIPVLKIMHELQYLSVSSQDLVGCIFGKEQTNAKMEH